MTAPPATATPTPLADRAPAPDLARGAMLLLICLANAHLYLTGRDPGVRGYPDAGTMSAADRVVTVVQMTVVDGRAFPMFAMLVGYGSYQLVSRRTASGATVPEATRLVRRRGAFLLLFGAAHGILLFPGDIAGAYGLLLVAGAGLVVSDRTRALRVLVVVQLVVVAAFGALQGIPVGEEDTTFGPGAEWPLWGSVLWRVVEWVFGGLLGQVVAVFGAIALGTLVARRRWLDEPTRHRAALLRTAAVGLGAAVLGGVPLAAAAAGWWAPGGGVLALAGIAHALSGYAGGAGAAALAGVVALRVARRGPNPAPLRWLEALGRRSLSGYLLHSVVFVAVFTVGGLGTDAGIAVTAAVATATWLLLVLLAALADARGVRGPAEVLLRRLTYGGRPVTVRG